ncbi:MAG: NAD(P)H-binding protein [Hyphomicrobiales bacterium]
MKIVVFGATGMIGQAVMKEAMKSSKIESITIVGRSPSMFQGQTIKELLVTDLFDLSSIEDQLKSHDACLFCVGVSAAFLDEKAYTHLTYDLTIKTAETVLKSSSALTFVYVTGQGTDSSEAGRVMWARVKGRTENKLLNMPFKAAYMFRPGAILPLDGIRSKTKIYDLLYQILGPFIHLLRRLNPARCPTTKEVGRAMLAAAEGTHARRILDSTDIIKLANT